MAFNQRRQNNNAHGFLCGLNKSLCCVLNSASLENEFNVSDCICKSAVRYYLLICDLTCVSLLSNCLALKPCEKATAF